MDLEHKRPAEREYGPDIDLVRRRVFGGILICLVIGFLAIVVTVFGNDNPRSFYGDIYDESDKQTPSVGWFALKAAGMAALALLIPWLATRRSKPEPDGNGDVS